MGERGNKFRVFESFQLQVDRKCTDLFKIIIELKNGNKWKERAREREKKEL